MSSVLVWYDGACPLCAREIAVMRQLDWRHRIAFVDASDPTSVCPLDRATLLTRFHASEDQRVYSGAAAFAVMWRAVPLLRPFGLMARNTLALRVLEAAYVRFLRLRPSLQRWLR